MRHKQLNLLLIGQTLSLLGSNILRFSLSIYVLDLTGRIDLFASMLAISIIPGIILLPFGGVIVDKFDKKKLLILFELFSFFSVLLFFMYALNYDMTLWMIGALITLVSSIYAIDQAAIHATLPQVVKNEQLAKSNGMINAVTSISSILGPVLGGIFYKILGVNSLILISSSLIFASTFVRFCLDIKPLVKTIQDYHHTVLQDLKTAFMYTIKANPTLMKMIVLAAVINLMIMPFIYIGVPYMLRVTMMTDDVLYGVSISILQVSGILGSISIGLYAKYLQPKKLPLFLSLITLSLLFAVLALLPNILDLGFFPSYLLLMISAFPTIFLMTIFTISIMTIIQKSTTQEHLGKVLAMMTAMITSVAPIGQFLFGKLFHYFEDNVFIPMIMIVLLSLGLTILSSIMFKDKSLESIKA